MKIIKKRKLFKRAEIELTEEEYQAYNIGLWLGRAEGFCFAIVLFIILPVPWLGRLIYTLFHI